MKIPIGEMFPSGSAFLFAAVLALFGLAMLLAGCAQQRASPGADGTAGADRADGTAAAGLCSANSGARIFYCGNSTYLVRPLVADLGSRYVDANGTVLAQCNGFINKPQAPECLQYMKLECGTGADLCSNASGQ